MMISGNIQLSILSIEKGIIGYLIALKQGKDRLHIKFKLINNIEKISFHFYFTWLTHTIIV